MTLQAGMPVLYICFVVTTASSVNVSWMGAHLQFFSGLFPPNILMARCIHVGVV